MYADGVIRELASSVHTGCPNQLNESLMPIRPLCVKNKEMGIHQRANAIPRWARVLAMLLLVTSLTCTVAQRTHDDGNSKSRNDAAPSSSAPIAGDHTDTAFVGQWVNEDPNGLTSRLVIKQQGTDLQVHAWGVCRPDDVANLAWERPAICRHRERLQRRTFTHITARVVSKSCCFDFKQLMLPRVE